MPLPEYINCHSKYITHCDFYLHDDCPATCNFATDDEELGVGAPMIPIGRQSEKGIDTKVNKD